MLSERAWLWLVLACALGVLGGCKSVPGPTGDLAASEAQRDNDRYDGWLGNALLGRKNTAGTATNPQTTQKANPQAAQVVEQAPTPSMTQPLPGINDPNVQKASASFPQPTALNSLTTDSTQNLAGPSHNPAGPPPTLPAELPGTPTDSVSLNDVKVKDNEPEKTEKKGFEWGDLAPETVYKNMKKSLGYGPDKKKANSFMQDGKKLFAEKKYKEAAEKFSKAADRWPDSAIEEDAFFLWGESSFFADRYADAHDAYGGLLKKYGNTRHLDTVIAREFAIARYWEQMYDTSPTWPTTPNLTDKSKPMFDTFGYAVQAYERIRMYDPRGPLADDSLMALGDAYFRRGQWEQASYNYDLLCKEYPNSKYQKNAHLLALRANMYKYQGSAYDDGSLKDADRLAQETLKQFGKDLGDEQERVVRAHTMIIEERANREFIRAEYYESRKYYGAARLYYYTVIKDFPTTQRATEARERFEKIRGLPDEPPKHFKWLLDLFGTSK